MSTYSKTIEEELKNLYCYLSIDVDTKLTIFTKTEADDTVLLWYVGLFIVLLTHYFTSKRSLELTVSSATKKQDYSLIL